MMNEGKRSSKYLGPEAEMRGREVIMEVLSQLTGIMSQQKPE